MTTVDDLYQALQRAFRAVDEAEKARDAWEPNADDSDHTAPYDEMLDESYALPDPLDHLRASALMREHNWSTYIDGFNNWEDGIRSERDRRATWSDFDALCEEVEEAESERDDAQEELDDAQEELDAAEAEETTNENKETK